VQGLASALQNDRVPRSERERGDLDERVGAGLEDGPDDADRHGDLVQFEVLVEFSGRASSPERVVLSGDAADHLRDALDLRFRELQSVDEGLRVLALLEQPLAFVDVPLVFREDLVGSRFDRVGDLVKRARSAPASDSFASSRAAVCASSTSRSMSVSVITHTVDGEE